MPLSRARRPSPTLVAGLRMLLGVVADGHATPSTSYKVVRTVLSSPDRMLAVNSDKRTAYVVNYNDTVSVFDMGTNVVSDTIGVGSGPTGVAVDLSGVQRLLSQAAAMLVRNPHVRPQAGLRITGKRLDRSRPRQAYLRKWFGVSRPQHTFWRDR